ncbi:MAG: DUF4349 domain-containing protein [Oscillospiraceae bacterium]|nr:DUF4349 domain-containing protein [Oscillospiraceae bacterium]
MKGKKLISLLLAALMTMAALAGCGAATEAAADNMAAVQEMKVESPAAEEMGVLYSTGDSADTAGGTMSDQKLITRVNISAETEDLDGLLEELSGRITELGGYVEYQDIYNGSTRSSYRYRSASLTIRIPAENLNGFVERVKGASNVVSMNQSQENVTLTYVATESRVQALETEQARLLELMEQAETMTDLLEIEERLTEVRYELESVTSQLRVLSNQVDYATVELSIEQVTVFTEVEEQTVWQRIGTGFRKNLKNLGEGLVDFLVWAVTYSPQLVILAAVIAAVILLLRRGGKKRRAKKNQMPPFQTPPHEPKEQG